MTGRITERITEITEFYSAKSSAEKFSFTFFSKIVQSNSFNKPYKLTLDDCQ